MKKVLLIIVLFVLGTARVGACGPFGVNYDAYVFRLCPSPNSYVEYNDQRLADAWSALIGQKVTVAQSRELADITLEQVETVDNPIAQYARTHKEVGDYVRLLVQYLQNSAFSFNSWDYPTPEEIANYNQSLQPMLDRATRYKGKLLHERYYLLRMRILFRQHNYQGIITMWEKNPLQGHSVFADMARDYYAGALYHLDRREDAAVQYAMSGNLFDAHLCMRDMHGAKCLKRVVESDPNSPVLPYMLEEIVNGCRESFEYYERMEILRPYLRQCLPWQKIAELRVPYICLDYGSCPDDQFAIGYLPSIEEWYSLVHAFQVGRDEYQVLDEVIERQLANAQVKDRCMWMSAKAYLHYLKGSYDQAWDEIQKAVKMNGGKASVLNAQYLSMLLSTRQPSLKVMESTLAKYLTAFLRAEEDNWVHMSADSSYTYYDNGGLLVNNEDCLNHLVKHGIVARYLREGDSLMATMAWSLVCRQYDEEYYAYLPSIGDEHYRMFVALSLAKQQKILDLMTASAAKQGALLHLICQRLPFVKNDYLDVVGTTLIRNGRFAEAIPYLEQVPLEFLSRQPIAPYAAVRSIQDLPWVKKVVDLSEDDGQVKLTKNAKVEYCREVLALQKHIQHSSGEDRYMGEYNLGALYHQASTLGSCWWLSNYFVSSIYDVNVSLSKMHFDFVEQSRQLLVSSLKSRREDVRYQAYYLLLHQGHDGLYYGSWDDDYTDYSYNLHSESAYYPILCQFKADLFGKQGMPEFVSNCDDLFQMYKLMK